VTPVGDAVDGGVGDGLGDGFGDGVLDRDLVVVTGPDAFPFLQSLVSQDLDGMAAGDVRPSLLLSPQGKLDVACRVARVGDEAWLDVDAGFGARLAASLDRFRIRVQVTLEDRSDGWGMVAVRGAPVEPPPGAVALPVAGGVDLIGPASALVGVASAGLSAAEYERARIEAGAGRLGADLDESVIPQEAFLEGDAVSFTKGCFLGQELVCRIDTRGHVNRYLRRLDVAGPDRPEPGAPIHARAKVVGAITSVTPADDGPVVALGFVRREVEPPAEVVIGPDAAHGILATVCVPVSR
jgi:folate-binding protein YgfZ